MPLNATARLAVVMIAALSIRLGAAAMFVGLPAAPDGDAQPDQLDYEHLAWSLSSEGRYATPAGEPTAHRPPGTSFALVPIYEVFGRSYTAARVWFCLIGAATCLVTGLLTRIVFRSDEAALAAASILAVYPGHFYYSLHFVSEVPFGFWLALAPLLALSPASGDRSRLALDLGAGLAAGLATLTRPQLLFLLPLAALAFGVARPGRPAMRRMAIVVVAFALCLGGWVVRNALVMQKPTLSTVGGYTFWGAHNPVILAPELIGLWVRTSDLTDAAHPLNGTEVENEAAAWRYGMEFVAAHARDMPRLLAWKVLRLVAPFEATSNRAVYWAFALSWLAIAPLVVVGAVALARARPVDAATLFLPLAATLVSTLLFYGSIRFRDSNAPVLACLAGGGAVALVRRLAPVLRRA